jgi:hypothetical protein
MQALIPTPLWFSNIWAADLIHGTKIVYSEDNERHRLAYKQRFICDLWLPLRKKLDNFSIGTKYAMHEKQYVRADEHGVRRIGTTRGMLDSLAAGLVLA